MKKTLAIIILLIIPTFLRAQPTSIEPRWGIYKNDNYCFSLETPFPLVDTGKGIAFVTPDVTVFKTTRFKMNVMAQMRHKVQPDTLEGIADSFLNNYKV